MPDAPVACERDLRAPCTGAELLELELLERKRLEGARLAFRTVRHELGNGLTPAIGYAQLLLRRGDLPPDVRQALERIADSVVRAGEVVRQMVEIERVVEQAWPGREPTIDIPASRRS